MLDELTAWIVFDNRYRNPNY